MFSSATCLAQPSKIDSLESELKKAIDTSKVNVLIALAWEYRKIDLEKALRYSSLGLAISEKNDFKKGKGNTYSKLGDVYYSVCEYGKALEFYSKSLKIQESIDDIKGEANCLNSIGNVNVIQGDYEKGLNNYLKSLEIYESIGDKKAMPFNNIAASYYYLGNYEKALEYYIKALKIFDNLGNKKLMINPALGVANVYVVLGNYKSALAYYKQALAMSIELGNKSGLSVSLNGIGIVYENLHNNDTALVYYLRSLQINEETENKSSIANSLMNIGNVYSTAKNYKRALKYYHKALYINEKTENKNQTSKTLLNIGILYSQQKEVEKALEYFKKGLVLANSIKSNEIIMHCNENISEVYEKKGDYEQAYYYHKLYSDVKDSLLNERSGKQIAEMNTKYESEKKAKDILLLTKDKDLQQAEIAKQKLLRNGTIGGLVCALSLAFILFNRFRVTSKQKTIIESQKFQIVESINYSKKIQDSLLPNIEGMRKAIPNLFVFYEPKDIVSGDFYYFCEFEKYTLLACVDCTGHGVPGGFMSTLGCLLLDKIANSETLSPSDILNKLSDEIIRVLHQQDGGEIQDGMDLSICLIDRKKGKIDFSGARNGIILVSADKAKRYKADPLPVGGNYVKKGKALERSFKTQSISIDTNDWIYMYTDGFMEQVGGEDGVPMNYTQFENQLIGLSKIQSPGEKNIMLQTIHDKWRGTHERDDDILILGFQVV